VSHPGGSPANVAVGLARLGVDTALLGRLSGDVFGKMLRGHLRRSGVALDLVVDAAEPSTLAVVSVDEAGVASYDFWVEGTADFLWTQEELARPFPETVRALHTGSMALEIAPGAERLLARLEELAGTLVVSYDPNVRLARRGSRQDGLAAVERVVALADVVKVSSEDLAWLLPDVPHEQVLERWRDLGPGLVVVTDGPHGSLALGAGEVLRTPARPVAVVDTVGAGDAFSAGLLAGLDDAGLLDRDALRAADETALRSALVLAGEVAGITCGRPGADPPTRAEVGTAAGQP
jgi:fructokinase